MLPENITSITEGEKNRGRPKRPWEKDAWGANWGGGGKCLDIRTNSRRSADV